MGLVRGVSSQLKLLSTKTILRLEISETVQADWIVQDRDLGDDLLWSQDFRVG